MMHKLQDQGCAACQDLGYLTKPGTPWATAVVCPQCSQCPPECDGTGRLLTRDERGRTYVTACPCAALKGRVARYNRARLPAAYHGKTVESFEATNAEQRAVKHWLLAFQSGGMPGGRGILMLGNPGIGKTHLLTGILRFLVLERGLDCRYVDAFHLLEQLKATFEAKSGTSALMSEVTRIPILAIDELGKSRTSGWQAEVLDQIISHRYNQGLTTFATSNFGPRKNGANAPPGRSAGGADASSKWAQLAQRESLEDRIGARIYSRLMEMCKPFLINGDDRRLRDTSGSAR